MLTSYGQHKPMFSNYLLNNPIDSSQWFDSVLELVYVDIFEELQSNRIVCLENGYVQHQFSEEVKLGHRYWGATPISVDIVFTKYPLNRDDWQTNYFILLANRLKELFLLDPSLNSSGIKWRLVMQTRGKSAVEAKDLFHGIVITLAPQTLSALPAIAVKSPIKMPLDEDKPMRMLMSQVHTPSLSHAEIKSILYPQSVYVRDLKRHTPERVRRKNDPSCSKFTTRADRPKSGLWSRIFR